MVSMAAESHPLGGRFLGLADRKNGTDGQTDEG